MKDTKQRANCLICLSQLKHGDIVVILPCSSGERYNKSLQGDSFGTSLGSGSGGKKSLFSNESSKFAKRAEDR